MTDREAIKGLANIVEYWTLNPHEQECAKTAIYALQERIDRETVCDHCRDKDCDNLWEPGGPHDFRINGDAIFYYARDYGWEGAQIRFCPWCGRPLKALGGGGDG